MADSTRRVSVRLSLDDAGDELLAQLIQLFPDVGPVLSGRTLPPLGDDGVHLAGHAIRGYAAAGERQQALQGGVDGTRRPGFPCSHGLIAPGICHSCSMFLLCSISQLARIQAAPRRLRRPPARGEAVVGREHAERRDQHALRLRRPHRTAAPALTLSVRLGGGLGCVGGGHGWRWQRS